MAWSKYPLNLAVFSVILWAEISLSPSLAVQANTNLTTEAPDITVPGPNHREKYPRMAENNAIDDSIPDSGNAPTTTTAGGTHVRFIPPREPAMRGIEVLRRSSGQCPSKPETSSQQPNQPPSIPLTPLVPQTKMALTLSAYPTLFVYVPASSQAAELTLLDENLKVVYKKPLSLTGKGGIISIALPTDTPELEIGKYYQWFVSIICNPEDRSNDRIISGVIKRVTLPASLNNSLKQTDRLNQAVIYAANGIWLDTLTTLAEMQWANPQDPVAQSEWQELLKSAGLGAVADEPLVKPK